MKIASTLNVSDFLHLRKNKMYKVDWTKIKTLEDVIEVLSLLEVNLTEGALESNPHMKDKVVEKDG